MSLGGDRSGHYDAAAQSNWGQQVGADPALGHRPHRISEVSLGTHGVPVSIWCPESIPSIPETEIMIDVLALAPDGSGTFVDIGAHCGFWSAMMSTYFRHCIAYEPARYQFELLQQNISCNALLNVSAVNIALSDDDGVRTLQITGMSGGTNTLERVETPSMRIETCRTATLDSFAHESVTLMKIDVEGHELQVLLGSVATIRQSRPLIVFESLQGSPQRTGVLRLLSDLGYTVQGAAPDRDDMFFALPRS